MNYNGEESKNMNLYYALWKKQQETGWKQNFLFLGTGMA